MATQSPGLTQVYQHQQQPPQYPIQFGAHQAAAFNAPAAAYYYGQAGDMLNAHAVTAGSENIEYMQAQMEANNAETYMFNNKQFIQQDMGMETFLFLFIVVVVVNAVNEISH